MTTRSLRTVCSTAPSAAVGAAFRAVGVAARLAVFTVACAGSAASGDGGADGDGPAPLGTRREQRVLVTRVNDVTHVAVSRRFVFAASSRALSVYDRAFEGWLPPLTVGDGYPGEQRVQAFAADPASDAVWIGVSGAVVRYEPVTDMVTRTIVPGLPRRIIFDRRDPAAGAYVESGGEWTLINAAGFVTQRVNPPSPGAAILPTTLADIYREYPALQSFERTMVRDAQLRSWPVTSGARAPDRTEVWLGTYGNGVFQVDPYFNAATPRPAGLLDAGAAAVALAANGVWAAGIDAGGDGRGGVSFVRSDLREFAWLEGDQRQVSIGGRARDLSVRERAAWIATSSGLVRMDIRTSVVRIITATDGLPDDGVLSVLARAGGAWAGTVRGAAFVSDTAARAAPAGLSVDRIVAPGMAVRALASTGDTLWLGTDAGLLFARPAIDTLLRRPSTVAAEPRLRRSVNALAWSDSLLLVAVSNDVLLVNLRTGDPLSRIAVPDAGAVGSVTAVAIDARALVVAGSGGLLIVSRETGALRRLNVGGDLAAEPLDLALGRDYLWVATRAGVMRLRRSSDGSIP